MNNQKLFGKVQSVDTGNVIISSDDEDILNGLQVNNIVKIQSNYNGEEIIGIITQIMRKGILNNENDGESLLLENSVKVTLIGTLYKKIGEKTNIFKRSLATLPSVDAKCYILNSEGVSKFMASISHCSDNPLNIGKYALSKDAEAHLDGNKFFQRHAIIVGGTGSGKSYTVANLLEKASQLSSSNILVFDLHGEYRSLNNNKNIGLLKIAGIEDSTDKEDIIFLPYWLLNYEEISSLLLDRSDNNAPNQSRILFDTILEERKQSIDMDNMRADFTIDSPIPYKLENLLSKLDNLDKEMVDGARGNQKQGPLHGKLTLFIQRLKSKKSDKRLNFIFNKDLESVDDVWIHNLIKKIMDFNNNRGIKIIDFSEVPSDILPLVTSLISRLIFSIQQWIEKDRRHPIAIFCDEAHLYIPNSPKNSVEAKGMYTFERIAKEGRKYGVSMVVISQRPSEVNKTVLSQCGNFIAMRLTNIDDQNVIKSLLPDNLGTLSNILPILDVGEALIVGDACILPTKVIIDEPIFKPLSTTIDFWDEWGKENTGLENDLRKATQSLINQSKSL